MNPLAPVTSALRIGMGGNTFTILVNLLNGHLLRLTGLCAEPAVPVRRQLYGLLEAERRTPAEQCARLGAVEVEETGFGKATLRIYDLRASPRRAQALDQHSYRPGIVMRRAEIPVIGSGCV